MTADSDYNEERALAHARKWQIAVALFVLVGCIATVAYTWIETFRG